jgi:hypothetical protein
MLIALSASACVGMATKAKPFDSPLPFSLTRSTEETVPAVANKVLISSYVDSNIHFITSFSGTAGNKNDRDPIRGSAVKLVRQRSSYLLLIQCSTHSVHRRRRVISYLTSSSFLCYTISCQTTRLVAKSIRWKQPLKANNL